jgi:hypothetical protein
LAGSRCNTNPKQLLTNEFGKIKLNMIEAVEFKSDKINKRVHAAFNL